MTSPETVDHITSLIQEGEFFKLKKLLRGFQASELVELIENEDEREQLIIFRLLPLTLATQVFEFLDLEVQRHFLENLAQDKITEILNEMSPDDRTALLEFLPANFVAELVQNLSEPERRVTLQLLGYPEYSVGRLMTPDYIAIRENWTIEQSLDYVRQHGGQSETLNVLYVTDARGVLIDDIRIREFLLAAPTTRVRDIMDHRFVQLTVSQDQEEAIDIFRRNDRVALPVVSADQGILLGIVTLDDILSIREEEDTEDIQKFGGSEALDEPYITMPLLRMVQKRAGWLVALFLGEMFTATAMAFFQGELEKAVVLSLFVPLIISSGGNAGSQATSLIIRSLTLGEITVGRWWDVMRRELFSGLALGAILGAVGFIRILVWQKSGLYDYGPHWALVGITVAMTLVGIVLWGSLAGSMLPLLLKKLGLDPATSSAPFVATLVDVTGLIIYFTVALLVLRGTLL
jgi:magnesium transporter